MGFMLSNFRVLHLPFRERKISEVGCIAFALRLCTRVFFLAIPAQILFALLILMG